LKNKSLFSSIALLLAALFWGCAFVAQDIGAEYLPPFTFNAIRMLLGGIILFFAILVIDIFRKKNFIKTQNVEGLKTLGVKVFFDKKLLITGVICGTVLAIASTVQQFGITLGTDAGKAGFITTLYIVLVPVFGVFMKKRPKLNVWIGVLLAVIALYFLCISGDFAIKINDLLVFICAFCFAGHIIVIDKFASDLDSLKVSSVQFITTGILCSIMAIIFETPKLENVLDCILPLLYMAVFSTGIAYTLQVVAQKNVEPTIASLLMSFEAVFAVLAGWVFGDILTTNEIIGCVIMFVAVVLAQIEFGKKKNLMK